MQERGEIVTSQIMSGVAQGAIEPLLIGFSFLDQWAGHVTVAASRAAIIEPARTIITLSMTGLAIHDRSCTDAAADGCGSSALGRLTSRSLQAVLLLQMLLSIVCFALPIKQSLRLPRLNPAASPGPHSRCPRSMM